MPREISIPEIEIKSGKYFFKIAIEVNNTIFIHHCAKKPPRHGQITMFGIQWNSFEDYEKDAQNTCHEFYQLVVFNYKGRILAPGHADEVYNMRINPYLNTKIE